MKIEVNLEKKYFFGLLLIGLVLIGIVGVVAFNSNPTGTSGNPAVFGHSVDEIDWSKNISGSVSVSGNVSATRFCIGTNCITSWPTGTGTTTTTTTTNGAGLSAVYANLGEDVYGPWTNIDAGDTDTCIGASKGAYTCAPDEQSTCVDIRPAAAGEVGSKKRSVTCVKATALGLGGVTSPTRTLDLSSFGQITFGNNVIPDSTSGIYWHSGSGYGIYRTAGDWDSTIGYQQLRIQFDTGIIIDGGSTTSIKSGIVLQPNGGSIKIGNRPLYEVTSGGCESVGALSLSSTCTTVHCTRVLNSGGENSYAYTDPNYFYNCDGNCYTSYLPVTCNNHLVGS